MQKIILSFLLIVVLLCCFSQVTTNTDHSSRLTLFNEAEKEYGHAEKLAASSDKNESLIPAADAVYKKALQLYDKLLPADAIDNTDSLNFFVHLREGLIYHYFDSLGPAKYHYLSALKFRGRINIEDSFFFRPAIFTGSIYYTESELDSALVYLKNAEAIRDKYNTPLSESQRLYNIFGVINFQTGNYQQAENYFEKALSVLTAEHINEKDLAVNYKINIGLTLVKQEEYAKAKLIYEELLQENISGNEIYHNLGFISLKENDFAKALQYFKKIKYTGNKKAIDLYLNTAMAYAGLDKADSVDHYIVKAKAEDLKWNKSQKNISNGLILKFEGDWLMAKKQFSKAADAYQQAIMQFENDFTDPDIYTNPSGFSGTFSYINLFNSFTGKADALEALYNGSKDIAILKGALNAYRAAFDLAGYVEKTYISDEARLFLEKIKYTVHSKPIDISLLLYNLTNDKTYLEEAYLFDQLNKASILTINIRENELKNNQTGGNELIQAEAQLRASITRLSLKATSLTDSAQQQVVKNEIRDREIELEKVQEKIYDDPAWQQKSSLVQIPSIKTLQAKLDNVTTILSYHLAEKKLLVFLISSDRFEYYYTDIGPAFFSEIESLKTSLHNIDFDQRYNGTEAAMDLYKKLLGQVEHSLLQKTRLIIIPDDELNYLPFESLQNESRKYLVEKFSVQYQYSTALLGQQRSIARSQGTLAFAPFTSAGYKDTSGETFSVLPASKDEVKDLKGIVYTDADATKSNFLATANKYSTIHLATHASANNGEPGLSFIAFFPADKDYKLYAEEIYNLRLDSTQLVILSACETGTGKLVKGEGLLSLSRAFAYAGCPNIVTSLWKAEDKTTAFLTQQLHIYLKKGLSKDKALQQAKLDLLRSEKIAPQFKTPNYWANFIFIGDYEPGTNSSNWFWIALAILAGSLLYILFRKKPRRSSHQGTV